MSNDAATDVFDNLAIDEDIVDLDDDELIEDHDGRGENSAGQDSGSRSDDDDDSDADPEDGAYNGTNVAPDVELGSDVGDAGTRHLTVTTKTKR